MRRFKSSLEFPFNGWCRSLPFLAPSLGIKISDDEFSADAFTNSKTLASFDRIYCKIVYLDIPRKKNKTKKKTQNSLKTRKNSRWKISIGNDNFLPDCWPWLNSLNLSSIWGYGILKMVTRMAEAENLPIPVKLVWTLPSTNRHSV